jgi:hypothetical protein
MTEEQDDFASANGQEPQVNVNVEGAVEEFVAPEEQAPQGPPPIADLSPEKQAELEAMSPEERRDAHLALGPDGNPA